MGMVTGVAPRSDVRCRVIFIETWAGGLLQDRVLGLADRAESTGYRKRTFTFDSYAHMYKYMYRYYYIFKLLCMEKAAAPCELYSTVPRAFSQEQITEAAYTTLRHGLIPAT
jgi:hypothetical protein